LIAVDADVEIRYDRVYERGSSTDKISFEEFQRQEALEQLSINPWEQNISKCIQMADIVLYVNGGTEELFRELNTRLASKENREIFLS
jgi:dephospho-CoA kinase